MTERSEGMIRLNSLLDRITCGNVEQVQNASFTGAERSEETPAKKALKDLSFAMHIDPALAWSWHCNIAMMAQDAGAPHKEANERTADFMRHAFDVETTGGAVEIKP